MGGKLSLCPGIERDKQLPINLCKSLLMLHTITSSVDYKYMLKCIDIQLNEPTNKKSIKVPSKLLSEGIRKQYHKTLGD